MDHTAEIKAVARIAIVPTILDVVCRTTGMGFATVARVTDTRWIACGVLDNIQFGLQPGDELQVETTICHEVKQNGDLVIINDVSTDAQYSAHPAPANYGFQSYISMPIILRDGTFFGTLCAIDPKPRMLNTPETTSTFRLFAELIAFHLDADAKLAEAVATLEREREVAEFREQFIAVLGHDLRNPLAAVAAGTALLLRHPERATEIAGHMGLSIARMFGLIDDVMDFARGRLGDGLVMSPDADAAIGPVLVQVVQELRSAYPDRVIDMQFDLAGPVSCDRSRIAQLLSNLLGNALTHGASSGPVLVRATSGDTEFELTVANGGEPIPPGALAKLFQPFFRAGVRPTREGLGLGLYIASEIAKAHRGSLDASSTPLETRFTFRMPTGV